MTERPKIAFCVLVSLTTAMILMHCVAALPRYVLADPSARILCYFRYQIEIDADTNVHSCSATPPVKTPEGLDERATR